MDNKLYITASMDKHSVYEIERIDNGTQTEIIVDPGNTELVAKDGGLYNKSMTALYHILNGYQGVFEVPESVEYIYEGALENCNNITSILIPNGLTLVQRGAFDEEPYDPQNIVFNSYDDGLYLGNESNPYVAYIRPVSEDVEIINIHSDAKLIWPDAFGNSINIKKIKLPKALAANCNGRFHRMESIMTVEGSIESVVNFKKEVFTYERDSQFVVLDINDSLESDVKLVWVTRSSFGGETDNLPIKNGKFDLASYDEAVYVNEGTLKMKAEPRLLAMVYRLQKPYELEDDFKNAFIEFLTKNTKKVIKLADDRNEPEIIETLKQCGIVDDEKLKKARTNIIAKDIKKVNDGPVAQLRKLWKSQELEDGTLALTQYKGNETTVEVPEFIGKARVTVLDGTFCAGNFKQGKKNKDSNLDARGSIETIVLPESISAIEEDTFLECRSLITCKIQSKIKYVGNSAFKHCHSLKEIILPAGLESIGNLAFGFCKSLNTIDIPEDVVEIGDYAFCHTPLTDIKVSSALKSIGKDVFVGCDNLTIHTPSGSIMEKYAKEHGLKYDNKL